MTSNQTDNLDNQLAKVADSESMIRQNSEEKQKPKTVPLNILSGVQSSIPNK